MFVRLFRIKASESLEKCLAGAIYKEETKELLPTWECQIFTTVAIMSYRYERLAVLQNAFTIILLWARKYVEKRFEKTVYK